MLRARFETHGGCYHYRALLQPHFAFMYKNVSYIKDIYLLYLHFSGKINELQAACCKNYKKLKQTFIIKKKLFVWMNAQFVCEDKRDGAFRTPPVSFHRALPPHPPLSVPHFHTQPIIGAPDGSLMCSQRAPLHAHVSAVE